MTEAPLFSSLRRAALPPGVSRLVLASGSPRRAQLLTAAGYTFDVQPAAAGAECGVCSRETAPEMVARLALQKARDVVPRAPEALVLAADTLAHCRGRILGKPHDRRHAEEMLRLLSGREQDVYTGLCLWHVPSHRGVVDVSRTVLVMQPLSESQLANYLDSGKWEGKAGAFGYQDGNDWLRIREGSESNVVGLPMEKLADLLERFSEVASPMPLPSSD